MEWSIGCRMGCMGAGWYGVEHWLHDGLNGGRLVWNRAFVAGWGVCGQAGMEWSIGCRMGCMWYGVEHWLHGGVYVGRLVWSTALVAGWGVCGQAGME